MDTKVEQFLMKLPEHKRQAAMILREIILASRKNLDENIKWGQLTFSEGKNNIAFIYTFPQAEYINLGFFKATSLADPKKLFEGTGKGMRHIKISSEKDIPVKQIKSWVKEACEIARNTIKS